MNRKNIFTLKSLIIISLMVYFIMLFSPVYSYFVPMEINEEHKIEIVKAIEYIRKVANKCKDSRRALKYKFIANSIENFLRTDRIQVYFSVHQKLVPVEIMDFRSNGDNSLSNDFLDLNTRFTNMRVPDIASGLIALGDQILSGDNPDISKDELEIRGYDSAIKFLDDSGDTYAYISKEYFQEEIDSIMESALRVAAKAEQETSEKNGGGALKDNRGLEEYVQIRLLNLPAKGKSWVRARDGAADENDPWIYMDFAFDQPTCMALSYGAVTVPVLFVGGMDIAGLAGGIRFMTDSDHDGFPDKDSLQTLAAPGSLRIPKSMIWVDGDLFVLDLDAVTTETNRVYVIRDYNGDGMPDGTLELVADSSMCPGLPIARSLGVAVEGNNPVIEVTDCHNFGSHFFQDDMHLITDNGTGMGTYSTMKFYEFPLWRNPYPVYIPFDGDNSIKVGGQYQSQLELYRMKPGGVSGESTLLGSGEILDDSLNTAISLAPGEKFLEGDILFLKDVTQDITGTTFTVTAAGVEIHDIDPASLYSEDWTLLTGRGLSDQLYITIANMECQTSDHCTTSIRFEMPYLQDDGMTVGYSHNIIVEDWFGEQIFCDSVIFYMGKRPGANAWPFADAGRPQNVERGTSVTLDASGSRDDDGDHLSFKWTQPFGSSVTLSDDESPNPSFTATDTSFVKELTFKLEVTDGKRSASDIVGISVFPKPPGDVNLDGNLDASDLEVLIAHILNKEALGYAQLRYADPNADVKIDIADLIFIAKKIK